MRSDRALLAVSALLLASCLDPIPKDTISPPGTGVLAGRIVSACDEQQGLSGATVIVDERTVVSDAEGNFRLPGIVEGGYEARIDLPNYKREKQNVQINSGRLENIKVKLWPDVISEPVGRKLDVLFVVDNSGSMFQQQLTLADAAPAFLTLLQKNKLNLRIGVISTDVGAGDYALPSCERLKGDDGALQNQPRYSSSCTVPFDPWIAVSYSDDRPIHNVGSGTAAEALTCIIPLGNRGCGFEQPLAAIRRALDPNHKINQGFLRDDAALAVIVFTDEDDCSVQNDHLFDPTQSGLNDPLGPLTSFRCFEFGVTCDTKGRQRGPRSNCKPTTGKGSMLLEVEPLIKELKDLKGDKGLFFGLIAGPSAPVEVHLDGSLPTLAPSCQTINGYAVPPIRLQAVVDALALRGKQSSICATDLGPTMASIAQQIISATLGNACKPPDSP